MLFFGMKVPENLWILGTILVLWQSLFLFYISVLSFDIFPMMVEGDAL